MKTEIAMEAGRRTRQEIAKLIQMTALKFLTGASDIRGLPSGSSGQHRFDYTRWNTEAPSQPSNTHTK